MQLLFLAIIAVFMSAAGCALDGKVIKESSVNEPSRPEFPVAVNDAETLVQYGAHLRRLSANELNREHEALKQSAAKSKSDLNRAQLAMIYALPGLPLRDDAKAVIMLESLGKDAQSSGIRNFALLLLSMVSDNRRLDEGAQALAAKLKDEQTKSAELQQKLEALKSIEKSLSERDRGKSPLTNSK